MSDKIIIGAGKRIENKAAEPVSYQEPKRDSPAIISGQVSEPIPLDENVWGNDYTLLKKLDEKQLADRRLYVRVRHLQKVVCHSVYDNIDMEPVLLSRPMELIISDLSMGGIGIISENELKSGRILAVRLSLDGIQYEVKCEVIYCFQSDNKFRAGLKIAQKDKRFINHLKIFIARISLTNSYGQLQSNCL